MAAQTGAGQILTGRETSLYSKGLRTSSFGKVIQAIGVDFLLLLTIRRRGYRTARMAALATDSLWRRSLDRDRFSLDEKNFSPRRSFDKATQEGNTI